MVNFFRIFEITIFCFVVAICDLVHDVETIPDKKRNAYSDIFLFSLPFLVEVVL